MGSLYFCTSVMGHPVNFSQYSQRGRVAQRITRLTTDQKIAGSNPAVLEKLFLLSFSLFSLFRLLYLFLPFSFFVGAAKSS